jgi:hypothetical protein
MTVIDLSQDTLEQLEAVIQDSGEPFFEIGLRLMEIDRRGLYRQLGLKSFEDYLHARREWGIPLLLDRDQPAVSLPRDPKNMMRTTRIHSFQMDLRPADIVLHVEMEHVQSFVAHVENYTWRLTLPGAWEMAAGDPEMDVREMRRRMKEGAK